METATRVYVSSSLTVGPAAIRPLFSMTSHRHLSHVFLICSFLIISRFDLYGDNKYFLKSPVFIEISLPLCVIRTRGLICAAAKQQLVPRAVLSPSRSHHYSY